MYSSAPLSNAVTMSSSVLFAVTIITGTRDIPGVCLMRRSMSKPSTPGSMMSSMTTSGRRRAHAARNSASSATPSTSMPARDSAYTASSRMLLSSST